MSGNQALFQRSQNSAERIALPRSGDVPLGNIAVRRNSVPDLALPHRFPITSTYRRNATWDSDLTYFGERTGGWGAQKEILGYPVASAPRGVYQWKAVPSGAPTHAEEGELDFRDDAERGPLKNRLNTATRRRFDESRFMDSIAPRIAY